MASIGQLPENTTCYTELRSAANDVIKYVSYASYRDLLDVQGQVTDTIGQKTGISAETASVCELLLQNNEPLPLFSEMQKFLDSSISQDDATATGKSISYTAYQPYKEIFSEAGAPLTDKYVSLVYHGATTKVDSASILSDVSAMFCSLIPTTEMSLCVPYFDVKIIYPSEKNKISPLSVLGFVGASQNSNTKVFDSPEVTTLVGFDVAGMELFCLPQTLVASNDYLRSTEALKNKGVDILDPIMPLLTIESANVQITGLGGGLDSQTKIDLKLVLHDRSRLADIEALTSVEIFPSVTFRVTYGWAHPDTNKVSGGVYARLLNGMRTTQDFCLNSVSISSRDATSLSLSLTLISKGKKITANGKMITGNDQYLPYSVLQALINQFISIKSSNGDAKSDIASYSRVGSKIAVGASAKSSNSKFITIESYYKLYKLIQEVIPDNSKTDDQKISEIVTSLNTLDANGTYELIETDMLQLFDFPQKSATYGDIIDPPVMSVLGGNPFISDYVATKVKEISEVEKLNPTDSTGEFATVVPLAAAVAKLVAKPLLASQPDIDEVRIHCFSFNSACGHMAEENIGNFPIVISDLIQKKVEANKSDPVFSLRSSIDSATKALLAHVNNPASPFYGVSADYLKKKAAADSLKNLNTDNTDEIKAAQLSADAAIQAAQSSIDTVNGKILGDKKTFADSSFVPPKVKIEIQVLPAYQSEDDKLAPQKKIARITIYDDRAGGFNRLGNLVFSMINSNGIARINKDSTQVSSLLSNSTDPSSLFTAIKSTEVSADKSTSLATYGIKDKQTARRIIAGLYPTLTIGTDSGIITNATFTSQPSSDLASSFLFSQLSESDTPAGASATSEVINDIIIIPSTVTLTMLGNVCITRGQTYYVDFNTGTTLDNAYTVVSVTHSVTPGKFTTTVTMNPVNSASMSSLNRQIQDLVVRVKDGAAELDPNKPAASS